MLYRTYCTKYSGKKETQNNIQWIYLPRRNKFRQIIIKVSNIYFFW